MQQHVAGVDDLLQLRVGDASQRDTVIVAEINHRVAMRVGGDERLQFLNGLHIGEVIERERILLHIEIGDGVGADAGREDEIVVAWPADRHRDRLRHVRRGVLRIGGSHVVGLGQGLARRQIHLIAIGHKIETDRHGAVTLCRWVKREGAGAVGYFRRSIVRVRRD